MTPVEKAAAFFDEKRPGWFHAVDTDTLDLFSLDNCIIAQITRNEYKSTGFGSRYGFGMHALGLRDGNVDDELLGDGNVVADNSMYLDAWKTLIAARKAQAQ